MLDIPLYFRQSILKCVLLASISSHIITFVKKDCAKLYVEIKHVIYLFFPKAVLCDYFCIR